MRNILLVALTMVMGFIVACDDHDVLPQYDTPAKIFQVDSLFHYKDTVSIKGDTLKYRAYGLVFDSTYPISATLKLVDSVTNVQYGYNYLKTVKVKFDTSGYSKTKLIRWTNADPSGIYITVQALPAKTKLRSTVTFTYGLNLSSQMGTTSLTVKNNGYTQ